MKSIKGMVILMLMACATTTPHEPWPTMDQMGAGTKACANLCTQYGRNIQEYRYDGKCICRAYQFND